MSKDTMDVIHLLNAVTKEIEENLSDDGEISKLEVLKSAFDLADETLAAIEGVENIDDEIKALEGEELKKVAGEAIHAAINLAKAVQSAV